MQDIYDLVKKSQEETILKLNNIQTCLLELLEDLKNIEKEENYNEKNN